MSDVHGVLLVDKPRGPTSHDVVARCRRALCTREVGHAGTLDPAATGLLVVVCGEATKLAPYLTAADKVYEASVTLGRATDAGDGEGTTTDEAPVPQALLDEIARHPSSSPLLDAALRAELARTEQVPPVFSAVRVGGKRAHALARAGAPPALAPRPVRVLRLRIVAAHLTPYPTLELELEVSKGYYVRSLARDLGAGLGVPAHLSALRRTRSGAFDVADAVGTEAVDRAALLPPVVAARRAMPTHPLDADEERRVRCGQRVEVPGHLAGPIALTDCAGAELVAIAEAERGTARVLRGFAQFPPSGP